MLNSETTGFVATLTVSESEAALAGTALETRMVSAATGTTTIRTRRA
jgi:hypothetical protein